MRREIERSAFVFRGHSRDIPGLLWTLVHPDGECRHYITATMLEAHAMAKWAGADLALAMPPEVSLLKSHDPAGDLYTLPGTEYTGGRDSFADDSHGGRS